MNQRPPLLDVLGVHSYYGRIRALRGVSLKVNEGDLITLMGSNGAGKTTLLNTISGLLRPGKGRIFFEERRLDGLPPHKIVKAGIAQVPEGRKIFGRLSVLENLDLGAFIRRDRSAVKEDMVRLFELFPRLYERRHQTAGTLSGGEQQMLAMGRALMTRPRLLLLDEPSMGLAPLLVETIFDTITTINHRGCSILLVEQNANMALEITSRGYVIQNGEIVLEDQSTNLRGNEWVQRLYLGGELGL
ncbi:ABC transporter ATP-binding protein [Desulfatiglans anilini]|uniref:ABC transporter ATP-binding protein n=1 Tax=Desulfatiglans anilini TaxID=90728 RepID=UPI000404414F|nr:ABC transporter ATP-binding protein [Desulfatiglans anilini]